MRDKKRTETSQDLVFNPGSERSIISICLKNPEKLIDVEGSDVYPEHFGVKGNKYVFMAMMYLYSKQLKPTPMAIMEVLSTDESKGAVEELGGLEYLTLCEEANVPADNLPIFVEKVKQSYTRRNLFHIAEEVREFVMSEMAETLNPSELIGHVESKIGDLSINTSTTDDVYKMGDKTDAVLEERAQNPSQVPGLEVGWPQTDAYTGGGCPGDCIIVVAESKTGKSVTLTNWATNLSVRNKIPVLYIDTEMQSREQEDRILANLTGIPENEIKTGLYVMDTVNGTARDKIERLKKAKEELNEANYYHIYMPHFTIEKVTALARKFQMQVGIKALFFDYIKIPSSNASFRDMQEYQALGFFTSGLKDLAGTLQIPVWTAAQANRDDLGGMNKDAKAIGGSYRILQLASKLMFLVNKSEEQIAKQGYSAGNQVLQIKYQRNGQSDCPPINIMFNKPILRQEEV